MVCAVRRKVKTIKNCETNKTAENQTSRAGPAIPGADGADVRDTQPAGLYIGRIAGPLRDVLFFGLFYLYLLLIVDLRIIYHHSSGAMVRFPAFFRGWPFFRQFLSYPGGLVQYLSSLLAQFFYIGWAGALVVTAQALLLCIFTDSIIKAAGPPRLRILRYIPPILLLSAYTQYTFYFVTTTALLVSLAFAALYPKLTTHNRPVRFIAYAAGLVILYTIAGGAYLPYAVLCLIYECAFGPGPGGGRTSRWQMALLYLLSAAALPYVEAVLLFNVSIAETFSNVLPFYRATLFYRPSSRAIETVYVLYLFLPIIILASGLWRISFGRRLASARPADASAARHTGGGITGWLVETAVVFVIAGATVFLSYNRQPKTLFAVDCFTEKQMWPQVLQTVRRHPTDNALVAYMVNRALYHTGRLGYEMFGHPQNPYSLLLNKLVTIMDWKKYDIYLDMGQVNLAEHGLCEAMERLSERPALLKRLALVNMVKGKLDVARVYLNALTRTLFDADWAEDCLARIESDPNLSADKKIQRLRGLMPSQEHDYCFGAYMPPEKTHLALLEKNRGNRMAFEYLMAFYLLTSQLDNFIQNLYRLDDFDYPGIPRAYEEAILLYEARKGQAVDLGGRKISDESRRRFAWFSQIYFGRYAAKKAPALNELAKSFSDTYFFYYIYGYSRPKR